MPVRPRANPSTLSRRIASADSSRQRAKPRSHDVEYTIFPAFTFRQPSFDRVFFGSVRKREMKMDLEHLKRMAGECRERAKAVSDRLIRDEFLSLADYYELMARELAASNSRSISGIR